MQIVGFPMRRLSSTSTSTSVCHSIGFYIHGSSLSKQNNKAADQLSSNYTTDQLLCFYFADSKLISSSSYTQNSSCKHVRVMYTPLNPTFKPASNFVLLIVPSRYFCSGSFCFLSWCLKFFVLLAPYVCFHIFS